MSLRRRRAGALDPAAHVTLPAPWGAPPRSAPRAPRRTAPRCSAGAAASPRSTPARGAQFRGTSVGHYAEASQRRTVFLTVSVAVMSLLSPRKYAGAMSLSSSTSHCLAPHPRHADARLAVRMLGQVHCCCYSSGRASSLSCAGGTHLPTCSQSRIVSWRRHAGSRARSQAATSHVRQPGSITRAPKALTITTSQHLHFQSRCAGREGFALH